MGTTELQVQQASISECGTVLRLAVSNDAVIYTVCSSSKQIGCAVPAASSGLVCC